MKKISLGLLAALVLALVLRLFVMPGERPARTEPETETPAAASTPSPSPTGAALPALSTPPTAAPTQTPAPTAAPYGEEWFSEAVFVGDSITCALDNHCQRTGELGEALFLCAISLSVRNIVEDRLGVSYRGAERPVLEALAMSGASRVFLMLGTNDVALTGGIEAAMGNWVRLLDAIRAECPDMEIYVESVLPMYTRGQAGDLNNRTLGAYNERLRALCREQGCVFVDLAPHFADEEGGLRDEYCSDAYVHLTEEGAAVWASLLRTAESYETEE